MNRPHQPTALDDHTTGESTRHHVLYPDSIGQQLEQAIVAVLNAWWEEQALPDEQFPIVELEHPADPSHGDWATNVAMKLARPLKQTPRQIAESLVARLQEQPVAEDLKTIEVAGPGFINFHLNDAWLLRSLQAILEAGERFGQTRIRSGQRIMIEHTQPNSHKEIHVGHLRNSLLGMAEVRLHQALGYEVISTTYGGDVGPHIAKCLWGLQHGDFDLDAAQNLEDKVRLIQQAYIYGTQRAAEDPAVEAEVKRLNKVVYDQSDPAVMAIYQRTRDWSIEQQKTVYARIGSHFDRYYWESEVWQKGLEDVRKHIGSVFRESDGAVVFPGEDFGLHTRVFITSQGTAPYEAKDLGLIQLKLDEYDFDYCIIQTGNDQRDYFKVLIAAFEQIHPELQGKIEAEHYGMVNIPGGKMSSRHGNVVLAEDVLDEMHTRALSEIQTRQTVEETTAQQALAEQIALAATKYAMLKYDPNQDITFDPDLILSFTGDSGPYLQYVCVRINSLLEKADSDQPVRARHAVPRQATTSWSSSLHDTERLLLRKLYLLPEVVIRSALEYKPSHLTSYLFDLAQAFNDFYQACPVLQAENDVKQSRLELAQATRQVLKNGLGLLGIDVPERM